MANLARYGINYGTNRAAMGVDSAYQQQIAAANQRAALAEQRAAEAEAKSSPLVYSKGSSQPYMDAYNKSASMMKDAREEYRKSQSELRDAYRKQMETELNDNLTKSNQEYDSSAKQNYINYMQAQKRLPDELNALGIRGGASESSLIRLGSNYGKNVAMNESARGTALAGLRQANEQKLSDYEREYLSTLANYDTDYNNRLAEAYNTAYQNEITREREDRQKDLEYFSGAIEGLFGDTGSYDYLISQLWASDDPNKEYKIMLAQKAKQTLADKIAEQQAELQKQLSASSSSGGSKKSSKKSSGGGGSKKSGVSGSTSGNATSGQKAKTGNSNKKSGISGNTDSNNNKNKRNYLVMSPYAY